MKLFTELLLSITERSGSTSRIPRWPHIRAAPQVSRGRRSRVVGSRSVQCACAVTLPLLYWQPWQSYGLWSKLCHKLTVDRTVFSLWFAVDVEVHLVWNTQVVREFWRKVASQGAPISPKIIASPGAIWAPPDGTAAVKQNFVHRMLFRVIYNCVHVLLLFCLHCLLLFEYFYIINVTFFLHFIPFSIPCSGIHRCLQFFDSVGWAAGRASGL